MILSWSNKIKRVFLWFPPHVPSDVSLNQNTQRAIFIILPSPCFFSKGAASPERNTFHLSYVTHPLDLISYCSFLGSVVRKYYYGIPKASGSEWKVPLIKKRLLSLAVEAPCSSGIDALTLNQTLERSFPNCTSANFTGVFFLLYFASVSCSVDFIQSLTSWFCWFGEKNEKKKAYSSFSFILPPFLFPYSVPLLGATGFVVHSLSTEPSLKTRGFLLTAAGARKWEMTYTV